MHLATSQPQGITRTLIPHRCGINCLFAPSRHNLHASSWVVGHLHPSSGLVYHWTSLVLQLSLAIMQVSHLALRPSQTNGRCFSYRLRPCEHAMQPCPPLAPRQPQGITRTLIPHRCGMNCLFAPSRHNIHASSWGGTPAPILWPRLPLDITSASAIARDHEGITPCVSTIASKW